MFIYNYSKTMLKIIYLFIPSFEKIRLTINYSLQ